MSNNKFELLLVKYIITGIVCLFLIFGVFYNANEKNKRLAALQLDALISLDIREGTPPIAARCAHQRQSEICDLIAATLQSLRRQDIPEGALKEIPDDETHKGYH